MPYLDLWTNKIYSLLKHKICSLGLDLAGIIFSSGTFSATAADPRLR